MPLFQDARTGSAVWIDPDDMAAGRPLKPHQLSEVRRLTMVYLHVTVGLTPEDVGRVMGRHAKTVKAAVRRCISDGPPAARVEPNEDGPDTVPDPIASTARRRPGRARAV